jgi:hypothetical protein
MPFPRILIVGIAGADRDRAGLHIAVVDVPAFLAGVSRSATGELRDLEESYGRLEKAFRKP